MGTVDNTAGQSAACSTAVPVASSAEALHPQQQQHSEATSSGSAVQPEGGNISSVVMSQASPSVPSSSGRGRHISPHCRQQQHLVLVSESHKIDLESSVVMFVFNRENRLKGKDVLKNATMLHLFLRLALSVI